MSESIEVLLDEWANCGDGFDESKMLRRLKDELDERVLDLQVATDGIAKMRAERDEAQKALSHEIYCRDKATDGRTRAENERDQLKTSNKRMKEALMLILAESDNGKCNIMDSLLTCVNIAEHALKGNL